MTLVPVFVAESEDTLPELVYWAPQMSTSLLFIHAHRPKTSRKFY